jgi:glycerol-3-phosphate dehydrogenase
MKKFNHEQRQHNLNKLEHEIFDVLIVGGGINGAGVARDAASRGMRVAVIEANDFASGTSSRSSKLIHGGIRYLENLEFKLVFEALNERSILFEMAPHLVHPLKFMIPLFKSSRVGMFKMGLGMWLYDILSLFQTPEIHDNLDAKKTLALQGEVRIDDLVGSFLYYDAYMDDDRLVHETFRSANENGATIVNYVKATDYSFQNNIHTVSAFDTKSKKTLQIKAHHMISCVGPWTDFFGKITDDDWKQMLRPTKGIHLILPRTKLNLHQAVVMGAETGNRIIFGIPRGEFVIVGTTDTDFNEDPGKVHTTASDVEYLLKIINSYFPNNKIAKEDIISSYSGVRPLVKDDAESTGKTSREHVIKKGKNGILYVAGGKYTTYRKMAEETVDKLVKTLSIEQQVTFAKSDTKTPLNPKVTAQNYKYYLSIQEDKDDFTLAEYFGPEAEDIKQLYADYNLFQKMAAFHIDNTMCISIADFYLRRSYLMLNHRDHGLSKFDEIAQVFKDKLKVDEKFLSDEYNKILEHINFEMSWQK